MDRIEARIEAERLVGPAIAAQLTEEDWDAALDLALMPDSSGALPGDTGYDETVDPYWAAAEAMTALAIRTTAAGGGLRKFSAEGASFEVDAPDLWGMAAALRARSTISKAQASALGILEVDGRLSHYQPTSGGRPDVSVLPNGAIAPAHLDWT